MDLFPVELVSYICSLACTDDGSTIRSLSLVSKFFHEICVPLRYQSIILFNSEDVARLAKKLQSTPIHLRRILHLYMSLTPSQQLGSEDIARVFEVLGVAAPTAESLTFIYSDTTMSSSVIGRLFRIPFPSLRELTIHGYYPFPSSPWVKMPRLERLHLSGNRNPYGLIQVGCLNERLPTLTHLKVSGLLMACSFSQELRLALDFYRSHSEVTKEGYTQENELPSTKIRTARLPPLLRCIILEPVYVSSWCLTNIAQKENVKMMEELQEIIHRQNDFLRRQFKQNQQSLFVLFKNESKGPYRSKGEVLYDDWLDRLHGKNGCWED